MSSASISVERLPGCSDQCMMRSHDPLAHEAYGYLRAQYESPERIIRTGPLVVDMIHRTVTVEGQEVLVSRREWGILAYLAVRIGRWCDHDDVVAAVWGKEWVTEKTYSYKGYRATYGLLASATHRLKLRLGPAGYLISTTRHRHQSTRRLEMEPPT